MEAGKAGWEEAGGRALKSWTELPPSLQDYRNAFEKGIHDDNGVWEKPTVSLEDITFT